MLLLASAQAASPMGAPIAAAVEEGRKAERETQARMALTLPVYVAEAEARLGAGAAAVALVVTPNHLTVERSPTPPLARWPREVV